MKKSTSLLSFVILCFFLNSCLVGPASTKPEVVTNDSYRFQEAAQNDTLNLRWWELFADENLDTLIKIALVENKDLLIATSRIEQAKANYHFKKADVYPNFSINGNGSVGNYNGFISTDITNSTYIGAGLNWEIDFWGKFRHATRAAQFDMISKESTKRAIQIDLISEVAKNYFLLLDYTLRLEISKKTLALRDSSEKIIQLRFDYGTTQMLDLNQAQIQTAIAKASVPKYRRLVAQTENNLALLLGRNPQKFINISTIDQQIIPEIPSGVPSLLLIRRPDLIEKENLLYAQNEQVGVAMAQRYPSIGLTGLFGGASQNLIFGNASGMVWNTGINLFSPLFNFGKNKRRVEIERHKTQQAVYEYEKTVLIAFKEVEDALISTQTYDEEYVAKKEQVEAALNARSLAELRYDKGVSNYLEVIEYQRSAFDSELQLVEARQNHLNSFVQLYKALGGGWISKEEEEAANK